MKLTNSVVTGIMVITSVAAAGKDRTPDVELIRYKLPTTSVAVVIPLTLESCDPLKVSAAPRIVAKAGASSQSFGIGTAGLESARVKRELAITLHDNGTIATLNGANEDRTGSIIGNLLKTVFSFAGAFLAPRGADLTAKPGLCNAATLLALKRIGEIDKAIARWSNAPVPTDPKLASQQHDAIQTLATERGTLRASVLYVELAAKLDLDPSKLTWSDATKSYSLSAPVDTQDLSDTWLDGKMLPSLTILWALTPASGVQRPATGAQPADLCGSRLSELGKPAICLVRPANATVGATLGGSTSIALKAAAAADPTPVPISQWGNLQLLTMSAGFGSNKSVTLTLDPFGRPSEMKWSSQARAESITGTVADATGQIATYAAANNRLASEKREIDELTTQQTLNRLRACREILNAGGSGCPADAPVADSE
jgi:hypothetical protein